MLRPASVNKGKGEAQASMAPGYVALLSALLLGALTVSVTVAVIGWGLSASLNSSSITNSTRSKALADACAEEALEKVRSENFIGTSTFTIGSDSCSYTVTNTGGVTRTVATSATILGATRKVTITITAQVPKIVIGSWLETP